jgi:putative Ca2+/H+ antiporter (TMEM165/GDT1 family)
MIGAWDWQILGTVFGVVFLAQLPGKSALTALVLSSQYRLLPILAGAGLALAAHSAIAVAAGGLFSLLPARPIHAVAGVAFVVSAVFIMWRADKQDAQTPVASMPKTAASFLRTFGMALAAVFAAEWGDLTQLGTAALVARYGRPLVVLLGAVLGLWTATGVAILVGRALGNLLRPDLTRRIAATVFAGLGAALVVGIL